MELTIDLLLSDTETEQLAGTLGCNVDKLPEVFGGYASAAAEEYGRMILGQKVFTRGSDIQEYRLFLLVKRAFGNAIPDEQKISDLFQTTTSQSGSLVRSVMSKYQYELHDAIDGTCRSVLEGVKADGDGALSAVIASPNWVEKLNREIAAIDGTLPQIAKKRGAVSTYLFERSSYLELCKRFDIDSIVED
jgi:hypothetical protein